MSGVDAIVELMSSCVFDLTHTISFSRVMGEPVSRGFTVNNWFIFISSGKGCLIYEDESLPLERGILIYLKRGVNFQIRPGRGEALSYTCIGFRFRRIAKSRWGELAVCEDSLVNPCFVTYAARNTIKLEELLPSIAVAGFALRPDPRMNLFVQRFLLWLWEDMRYPIENPSLYARMEKVIAFIHEHYAEAVSLERLSSLCGVGKEYFSRSFKKYTGSSPIQFVMNIRMKKAAELLLKAYKVRDVARLVGILDEMHFSKIFKKATGLSPRAYKSHNIY
jgi:AraC-like DNA-binding protein